MRDAIDYYQNAKLRKSCLEALELFMQLTDKDQSRVVAFMKEQLEQSANQTIELTKGVATA